MNDPVATTEIAGIRPSGERITIIVQIGRPYLRANLNAEMDWACPVSLTPLYRKLADTRGADALQALSLATSLVLELLAGFKEDGGQLLNEDGSEFPIEAYCNGRIRG